jgi:hypothetical protein
MISSKDLPYEHPVVDVVPVETWLPLCASSSDYKSENFEEFEILP